MTYNTPTLLLVGAAQYLVLGSNSLEPILCKSAPDNSSSPVSRTRAEW
jgi:hypothetical protein